MPVIIDKKMDSVNEGCSGVFNSVKSWLTTVKTSLLVWLNKMFEPVRVCLKGPYFNVFSEWVLVQYLPVMSLAGIKGMLLDVALPILDVATDAKFAYDLFSVREVDSEKYQWFLILGNNAFSIMISVIELFFMFLLSKIKT